MAIFETLLSLPPLAESSYTHQPQNFPQLAVLSFYLLYASANNSRSQVDQQALAEITKDHGKIDHLVNWAGFIKNFDVIAYPFDRVKKIRSVNVDGTHLFATDVARHLMERRAQGSTVMTGSTCGTVVHVPQATLG